MNFQRTNFRTYDIRGVYPGDLNEEFAYNVGLAYADLFPAVQKVAAARDVRSSGAALIDAVIRGLRDGGKDVFEVDGIAPVPLLSFSICHYKLDGGIMVTASHNPPQWNGLKLQLANAYPVLTDDLLKIQKLMEDDQLKKSARRGDLNKIDPRGDYIEYLVKKTGLKKPLKLVIDNGNGSCGYLPEKIFGLLGCEVKTLYGEFDSSFPHHLPDPYKKENLNDLVKAVLAEKAAVGFAYDGDGDRVGTVDARGEIVGGDDTLMMLAREALKVKKGPVICEVRTSQAFLEDVGRHGGNTYFTVGYHKAVLDKIKETGAVFGGETTGHIYFPLDYYLYDDAIFSSLKLAEIVAASDDFSAYVESLPHYFTSPEIFIDYPDETKKRAVEKFVALVRQKAYKFVDVDGARIIFERGWATVRMSNTSPMIKAKFEGKTGEDLTAIEKEVIGLMREAEIDLSDKNYEELGWDNKKMA